MNALRKSVSYLQLSKPENITDSNENLSVKSKKTHKRSLSQTIKLSFKNNVMRRRHSSPPPVTKSFLSSSSSSASSCTIETVKGHHERPSTLNIADSLEFVLPLICLTPPPAPLVIEDPPSSENGSDLDEPVRRQLDPALLNGSSGSFGSAGARSAPSTPQGLSGGLCEPLSQPCSPGFVSPVIPRSPSHVFTKYDKGTLKQLSSSTPAMTAQAKSPEPPSPKAAKVEKIPSGRQKKFHRHFPSVDDDEKVLNYYSCALIGDILLQGHLYITKNYFAFYSNVFGYVTKLLIPTISVEDITKEKTARIIPNAVGVTTADFKHVFGSLMSRDSTYKFMHIVWNAARTASLPLIEDTLPEPVELRADVSDVSGIDSTGGSSGNDSPTPAQNPSPIRRPQPTVVPIAVATITNELPKKPKPKMYEPKDGLGSHLKNSYLRLLGLPGHSLLLLASTLLLLLLFLSAAVLLYRIGKIQQKYSLAFQDNIILSDDDTAYGDLLNWQGHLHVKSAGAVHNFLDSNLDQLAKVRKSLEALSTLLAPKAGQQGSGSDGEQNDRSQQQSHQQHPAVTEKHREMSDPNS